MNRPATSTTARAARSWRLLFGLRDRHGATLVLVTHAPELAERCDRIVRLADGALAAGGCRVTPTARTASRGPVHRAPRPARRPARLCGLRRLSCPWRGGDRGGQDRAQRGGRVRWRAKVPRFGDAQMSFTYPAWRPRRNGPSWQTMPMRCPRSSTSARWRSSARAMRPNALTQVQAVDNAYPLIGAVGGPAMPLDEALAVADGAPGAVMDAVLADRRSAAAGRPVPIGVGRVPACGADRTGAGRGDARLSSWSANHCAQRGWTARGCEPGSVYDSRYRLRCRPVPTSTRSNKRQSRLFATRGCAGRMRGAGRRALKGSSIVWDPFWCWSVWRGLPWVAWASPRRCDPILTARRGRSRR